MDFIVATEWANARLDRVLAANLGLSRSKAAALIASASVRVEEIVIQNRSHILLAGQRVHVDDTALAVVSSDALAADERIDYSVIYTDEHLVVVDKPAGLIVHPGGGHKDSTLVNGLLARFPELSTSWKGDPGRAGIVHRLDRYTSGLMVVALSERARIGLIDQLTKREVHREYLALVVGSVEDDHGLIDAPIGRSIKHPGQMAVSLTGKPARSYYKVLQRYNQPFPMTLLEVSLETGRTHQIRVHMAAIGHPVVGDALYGRDKINQGILPDRHFLHARALSFVHPITGVPVRAKSPLPAQLTELLDRLK
ncbi:MAG: RluA family pseudouridine synthase [Actinobacteria bacterium]|nr:RluA family pseudouridine synthase [Actinomycetota bacterium]MCL6095289.1 RluA family pseudouridine synthase [Actinomycetota bacterium]